MKSKMGSIKKTLHDLVELLDVEPLLKVQVRKLPLGGTHEDGAYCRSYPFAESIVSR